MGSKRGRQGRHHSGPSRRALPGHAGQGKYPLATIAYYGPDDRVPTKIAVGILEADGADPIMERWRGPGVATDPQVDAEIETYLKAHNVKQVVIADGILGCPHEEGIDFPAGQECPYCPFWRGKQGIQVR